MRRQLQRIAGIQQHSSGSQVGRQLIAEVLLFELDRATPGPFKEGDADHLPTLRCQKLIAQAGSTCRHTVSGCGPAQAADRHLKSNPLYLISAAAENCSEVSALEVGACKCVQLDDGLGYPVPVYTSMPKVLEEVNV